VTILPAPDCPDGRKTVSDAQGTFSHLGLTTMHAGHCTPTGPFITGGLQTLVAANGDQLEIEYNGFAPFPTPPNTLIHITGDFTTIAVPGISLTPLAASSTPTGMPTTTPPTS
jgi:hypothetical protein